MKFGEHAGAFARAHAGCSLHHNPDLWREAVVPKADRGTPFEKQYFDVRAPSTCALFGARCLEAAEEGAAADGLPVVMDLVLTDHYKIGTAVSEDEWVGGQHDALENYVAYGAKAVGDEPTLPTEPFADGDLVVINGPPYGVHVVVSAADVVIESDSSWSHATVQGGQADGGVEAFASTWHLRKDALGQDRLFAGTSSRYVIAVVRARKFKLDAPPIVDPGGTADDATARAASSG